MCYTRNTPISCDEFLILCKKITSHLWRYFPLIWCQREGNPQPVPTEASHSAYNNSHYVHVPFPIWENFPFDLIFKMYMSIYRQHAVLKRHKSNVALLEAKMLLLCIFLLGCCSSGSMGSAIEEFQVNFKALVDLVDLASKEVGHYLFFFIFYSSFDGSIKSNLGYFEL